MSARAHSTLILKVLGAERISNVPVLLIHIAILAAIYISSRAELAKMSRARKMARIPKKRRKRPLDICSLMDSSFLFTMTIPVIVMDVLYNRISGISFSLLAISFPEWCYFVHPPVFPRQQQGCPLPFAD